MARSGTRAPEPGTSRNYAAQAALGTALTLALGKALALIDLTDLAGSLPRFKTAAQAAVNRYAMASRALTLREYATVRRASGLLEAYRPPLTSLPPAAQVDATVDWATGGLWSPTGGGLPSVEERQNAEQLIEKALEQVVLDVGRGQMIDAVDADRTATAWAREARPDCCWFCAMLAARGAVYSSAEAAGLARPSAGQQPVGLDSQGVEWVNRYHRNCRCQVVPVFVRFEAQAHVREWQGLWNRTMRPNGIGGPGEITGMEAMQAAWREAFAQWQRDNHIQRPERIS